MNTEIEDAIIEWSNKYHEALTSGVVYEAAPIYGRHCAGALIADLERRGFKIEPMKPNGA